MPEFRTEAFCQLYEVAEEQQGLFTTKQAKAAGFAENIRTGEVGQAHLAEAVRMTFDRTKTHAIPSALVPPPKT